MPAGESKSNKTKIKSSRQQNTFIWPFSVKSKSIDGWVKGTSQSEKPLFTALALNAK